MSLRQSLTRRRLYTPPPLSPWLVGAYALFLAPAILGAAFEWPPGMTLALMAPAALAHQALGYSAARARGVSSLPPPRYRVLMMPVIFVALLVTFAARPRCIEPLIGLAIVMLVVDPIDRRARRRCADGSTNRLA